MLGTKKVFKAKIDDKEVELAVKSPDRGISGDAQIHFAKIFAQALRNGAILKVRLDDYMREQGVWNDAKQKQLDHIDTQLRENELKLKSGGIKLSEARKLALEMRGLRIQKLSLLSDRTLLEANTAEGQATNARFNYLVSRCLVYNDSGEPVFKDYENFLERAGESYVLEACELLANILYNLDNNFEKNLPENKFLNEWKFIDDKLRLINKDGQLVDEDGKLIDEDGRFINASGEHIDRQGNLVTLDGEFKVETKPFLDDDGLPIVIEK